MENINPVNRTVFKPLNSAHLLYAGVAPKTVQYLAGHENNKTTMDMYARVKYNKPEELFEVVNDALNQENFDEKLPISMVKE